MNCIQARALMELRRDGTLGPDEDQALARHIEGCRECAEWEAEIPAMLDLVRNAHATCEPDPSVEARMVESLSAAPAGQRVDMARHLMVLRMGWIAAAAAAVALLCLYSFRSPAGRVLQGSLAGNTGVVRSDVRYRTAETTAVAIGETARALLENSAAFSIRDGALQVHEGSCYVVSVVDDTAEKNLPTVIAAGTRLDLLAETCMYVHVPAMPVVGQDILETIADALVPSAWAAESMMTDEFVIVFSGLARLHVNGHTVALSAGDLLFLDRPDREITTIEDFIKHAERTLAVEGCDPAQLDRQIALYRHVIRTYEDELAAKRKLLASGAELPTEELAEVRTRQSLLEEAKAAHEERLGEFLNERARIPSDEQRKRLEEQLRRVRQAEEGYEEAVSSLLAM